MSSVSQHRLRYPQITDDHTFVSQPVVFNNVINAVRLISSAYEHARNEYGVFQVHPRSLEKLLLVRSESPFTLVYNRLTHLKRH